MPTRCVSFIGQNTQQSNSIASLFPSRWSNYGLAIWLPTDSVMLVLELNESWKEKNFLWFKRVPLISLAELQRRQVGSTEWSDEAIVVQGTKILAPGPPYSAQRRWHLFWPNHQSFVEELARVITKNPPPSESTPLPIHRGTEALLNWDRSSPIAVTFQTGKDAISDEWTGGVSMLYAYPGGPSHSKMFGF